jgi:hypothetical protein
MHNKKGGAPPLVGILGDGDGVGTTVGIAVRTADCTVVGTTAVGGAAVAAPAAGIDATLVAHAAPAAPHAAAATALFALTYGAGVGNGDVVVDGDGNDYTAQFDDDAGDGGGGESEEDASLGSQEELATLNQAKAEKKSKKEIAKDDANAEKKRQKEITKDDARPVNVFVPPWSILFHPGQIR